ncbi:MAG: 3-oxoacid CoA-transferase subunit B [Chloroflexi bacterium]|nr:3-oxoacid CoA-transferase subunit B [Chloroflexota bacterium]
MPQGVTRELVAARAARELRDGMYVNLGIGLPTLVSNFAPAGVILQAECGVLGYGRIANDDERDPDLINAGGQYVVLNPGGAFFNSADSFAMIRGGHVDVAILGGYQVSETGDLANWLNPERGIGSIGGAMDLVTGAKRVIVTMEHTTRTGEPKIVRRCSYPLTGRAVVNLIVTELAVIAVTTEGLVLRELAPGVTADEVQALTEPRLIVAEDLREMGF